MSPPRHRSLSIALYVNAALLAGILVALLARGGGVRWPESIAIAQQSPQAIAGGAGFYLMPAQFSSSSWGCYVMDVDAQTLVAYVYDRRPGDVVPQLRLAAARSFVYDRQLRSYNTALPIDDVAEIVRQEREQARQSTTAPAETTRPTVPND